MTTNEINDIFNESLIDFIEKEDYWVFEMPDEKFNTIVFEQEIPIYLHARKGGYRQYNLPVPTGIWLDAFISSSLEVKRILFAIIHNLMYEHTIPDEYMEPLKDLFVRPYQGYGHMALY